LGLYVWSKGGPKPPGFSEHCCGVCDLEGCLILQLKRWRGSILERPALDAVDKKCLRWRQQEMGIVAVVGAELTLGKSRSAPTHQESKGQRCSEAEHAEKVVWRVGDT
jgi:hypothetical protein